MSNKDLEDKTSLWFRMKFNEFKEAVWLEKGLSETQRSCILEKISQIEEITLSGAYS